MNDAIVRALCGFRGPRGKCTYAAQPTEQNIAKLKKVGDSASPLWIHASYNPPPPPGGPGGVPPPSRGWGGLRSTTVVTPPSPADLDEIQACKYFSDLKKCLFLL